jgi:hypothetical protein
VVIACSSGTAPDPSTRNRGVSPAEGTLAVLWNGLGEIRREQRQRHTEDGAELHLEKFDAVSIATLTKLSVRAVSPGEVRSRVNVIDAHHDGVHTVAFASQKFRYRTRISVIGCRWRDNFHAAVPVEHDLEADVGEFVPVKPESKGLQELRGCIEPLGCNGEHDVMHHRQRAWHQILPLGQGGYDVSKHLIS